MTFSEKDLLDAYEIDQGAGVVMLLSKEIMTLSKNEKFASLNPERIFKVLENCKNLSCSEIIEVYVNITKHQKISARNFLAALDADKEEILELLLSGKDSAVIDKYVTVVANDQSEKMRKLEDRICKIERVLQAHVKNLKLHSAERKEDDLDYMEVLKRLTDGFEIQQRSLNNLQKHVYNDLREKLESIESSLSETCKKIDNSSAIRTPSPVKKDESTGLPDSPSNDGEHVDTSMLFQCCKSGDVGAIKSILDRDPEIVNEKDSSDAYSRAGLHYASQYGHVEACRLLLSRAADVNIKNINGNTPLFYACKSGHYEICELLISRGASVNEKNVSVCFCIMEILLLFTHTNIIIQRLPSYY